MKVQDPRSEARRADTRQRIRRAAGLLFFGIGCGCIWLCYYGFNRLLDLMEDEGTESWTVKAGPFGITGFGLYLAMLFLGGISLIVRGIHLFTNLNPAGSCART